MDYCNSRDKLLAEAASRTYIIVVYTLDDLHLKYKQEFPFAFFFYLIKMILLILCKTRYLNFHDVISFCAKWKAVKSRDISRYLTTAGLCVPHAQTHGTHNIQ